MAEEKLHMTPYDLNDYFIENYYFIEEYCCCKQAQFCSNVGEVAAPIHLKGSSPNFASNIKRIRAINQAMFRLISKNLKALQKISLFVFSRILTATLEANLSLTYLKPIFNFHTPFSKLTTETLKQGVKYV